MRNHWKLNKIERLCKKWWHLLSHHYKRPFVHNLNLFLLKLYIREKLEKVFDVKNTVGELNLIFVVTYFNTIRLQVNFVTFSYKYREYIIKKNTILIILFKLWVLSLYKLSHTLNMKLMYKIIKSFTVPDIKVDIWKN